MYRRMKAREYFVEHVRQAYEKVYDEENNGYFYYNKLNSTSQWVTPKTLLGRSLDPQVTTLYVETGGRQKRRRSDKYAAGCTIRMHERDE